MHLLMTETLGYESYYTYGEDVSATSTTCFAATHPEAVDGILVTHAHFGTTEERAAHRRPGRRRVLRRARGQARA